MKLYHFPSPNPQKVTFALLELGLDCEKIPVDLSKQEQRQPAFLAVNPAGRVPVLVDGDVTLTESHAILAYLGETTGRLWSAAAAGRALALQWLFLLSQHIMPHAGEVALRIRARVVGIAVDEATVTRGEKALSAPLGVVEGQLAKNRWMLGSDFSLVDCAYCPILNVIEKAGFSFSEFPRISAYLEEMRSRQTWKDTPKLPMLQAIPIDRPQELSRVFGWSLSNKDELVEFAEMGLRSRRRHGPTSRKLTSHPI